MIPLYILGLLLRFGPQHGYQIKKLMEEQLEDFTQMKLPTVYYHLEKMEAMGLITAQHDKQGGRPEKTVYKVNDTGAEKFQELLLQALQIKYRPTFDIDGVLYFSDNLEGSALADSLSRHITNMAPPPKSSFSFCRFPPPIVPRSVRFSAEASISASLLVCSSSVEGMLPSS